MLNPILYPKLSNPWYLTLSRLRDVIAELAPACAGVVADYGCGSKPYRPLFTNASRYVGVDLEVTDPGDLKLRADFGLPLDDGSVDAVVSTQVLEHVPTVDRYLAECRRVLRPDGRMLLSTHGVWPYHRANAEDYYRWTSTGLTNDLRRNGFKVERLEPVCPGWFSIIQQVLNATSYYPGTLSRPAQVVFSVWCRSLNGIADLGRRLAREAWSKGETIPICYVVLARADRG